MNGNYFLLALVWFSILTANTLVGYIIGDRCKGRPVDGAIIGFLLGPLGWVLMAAFEDHRRRCFACRSVVDRQASICRWCGKGLPGQQEPNQERSS